MLESKGYKNDSAARGTHALDIIKRRHALSIKDNVAMYKIIFLDYSMPDMDGPQVSRAIRAFFNENKHQGV